MKKTAKKSQHLPVYGVGPLCVYSMVILLITGLLLRHFGILSSGEVPALRIPMGVVGGGMIALGILIWVKAVMISRIGDSIVKNQLVTTGIYAWVRNPIYSAAAIACTGIAFLFFNLWFFSLPLLFWMDITLFMKFTEEKWLRKLYGAPYEEYCRHVNRCIPWFPAK